MSVNLQSRTLRYGWGCFETLKLLPPRQVFFLRHHLERLIVGARICRLPIPPLEQLQQQVEDFLVEQNYHQTQVLRLIYTAEHGLYIYAEPLPEVPLRNAYRLCISQWTIYSGNPLNCFKSFNYLDKHLACLEAAERGYDDALLLNECGQIVESSRANVFFRDRSEQWYTPPLATGCLPGVIREQFVRYVGARELTITPEMLPSYPQVVLTNSLLELQSISQIEQSTLESPTNSEIGGFREYLIRQNAAAN